MSEQDVLFQREDDILEDEGGAEVQAEKYLLFSSDGLLFGVSAAAVVEIITNHMVTWLPLVPGYIRGIINLRGQIIPIVDIRRVLGREDRESDCMIILHADGSQLGILVDEVQKMVDVDISGIVPTPPQSSGNLTSGMCSLEDGQTMLVFDCSRLLEHA